MRGLSDEARVVYGDAYDERAIAARYGRQIGYWAFYLKTGVARIHPDPHRSGSGSRRADREKFAA